MQIAHCVSAFQHTCDERLPTGLEMLPSCACSYLKGALPSVFSSSVALGLLPSVCRINHPLIITFLSTLDGENGLRLRARPREVCTSRSNPLARRAYCPGTYRTVISFTRLAPLALCWLLVHPQRSLAPGRSEYCPAHPVPHGLVQYRRVQGQGCRQRRSGQGQDHQRLVNWVSNLQYR
jgi:hypothetical protein